jgi:hypothetical protein
LQDLNNPLLHLRYPAQQVLSTKRQFIPNPSLKGKRVVNGSEKNHDRMMNEQKQRQWKHPA